MAIIQWEARIRADRSPQMRSRALALRCSAVARYTLDRFFLKAECLCANQLRPKSARRRPQP